MLPRTSTATRLTIPNTKGLLVYDTISSTFWYNDGSAWQQISNGSSALNGTTNYIAKFTGTSTAGNSQIFDDGKYVGFGTTTPLARLHVVDSSVLFSAVGDIPSLVQNTPISSAGRRMMWYADKAAFRAGYAASTEFDSVNIGKYSVGLGYGSIAKGIYSAAIGHANSATGVAAFSGGESSAANGDYSFVFGQNCNAENPYAFSQGNHADAGGNYSIAMGNNTSAGGNYSFVRGVNSNTTGSNSLVLGVNLFDGGHKGNAMLGDTDPWNAGSVGSGSDDQMICRFNNGYYFLTGGNTNRTGMLANHGDNSWSQISDSTKQEKIIPVDGEDLLHKIANFKLGTWNYKGQDPTIFRHYGPMAQDFHHAFGHDALGTIGNDTLINQADFLGVRFTAIQALEKRTERIEHQQSEISALQKQNALLAEKNEILTQKNDKLQAQLESLLNSVSALDKKVQSLASLPVNTAGSLVNK